MNSKLVSLIPLALLLALFIQLNTAAPVDDDISSAVGEKPCLDKEMGSRMRHPNNKHKFLRCVSADTLWIETCPDNLFYNPSLDLCDWTVESKTTTRATDVVKHRPVLFKARGNARVDFLSRNLEKTLINNQQAASDVVPAVAA